MRRKVALLVTAAMLVAACSSGPSKPVDGGPNPTGSDPGPNTTSATNPGPNPTSNGPETFSGTLTFGPRRCARLTPRVGDPVQLELPSDLAIAGETILQSGRAVARRGDIVFVAGETTASSGRCGTIFIVQNIVSVQPT